MTIFDIDSSVEQLAARRNNHLPTPTKGRYMPLRAGVLNTWEYDDQQFWFNDGRLHLRGRNEAGKSKVLELVFPFVLDGDISPKKLDPFDTVHKSMWWNLIGFHPNRKVATGYVWIEFGRMDENGAAEYLTAIVGMQATRSDRTPTTWFGLTPQRVDIGIDLAPGDIPLGQGDFEAALSTDAQFETKATNHRANVGARLFAMGPERFNNLLHLLRQLRKPKLADKLDRAKLSDILTKALPPLDERRIEPLAKGFGLLDDDIDALLQTERSYRATTVFLEAYRSYARCQVRQRAGLVTATNTAFDNVTREESVASRAVEDAQKTSANLLEEAVALARRYADASGSLAGLDLSAVESLRSLEAKATADAKIANGAEGEAARARSAATRAAGTAADSRAAAETAATRLDAALVAARSCAGRASIDPGWEHGHSDQVASAADLAQAVRQRRVLVEAVAEAEHRAAAAREQLAGAEVKLAESQERREVTAEAAEAAVSEANASQEAFADALVAWMVAAPSHRPDVDVEEITDSLSGELAGGDGVARRLGTTLAAAALESAEAAVHDRTVDQAIAVTIHTAARSALAAHDALPADPPPPPRPGVAESRVGVPLWLAVEFADTLAPDEAAMLEAALDAAGLLDAIITESGLVDLHADDTLLVADPAGTGIGHWLRPVTEAPIDEHLVAAALASVGAGAGTAAGCWVDLDGSWANGPLTGRWSKPAAEYIGAAARAATSARRRVGLVGDLERAEAAVATASADLDEASGALRRAREWRDAFPSIAGWATAERDVRRTAADAAQAESAHRTATRAHDKVRQAGAAALTNVDLAVAAASCRPDDVPGARTALDDAAEAARELSSCAHDHATATGRCTRDAEGGAPRRGGRHRRRPP